MSSLAAIFAPPRSTPAAPSAPQPDPQAAEEERRRRRLALAALGRAGTIATSPAGLPGPAPVVRKTILGQ